MPIRKVSKDHFEGKHGTALRVTVSPVKPDADNPDAEWVVIHKDGRVEFIDKIWTAKAIIHPGSALY